MKVYTNLKAAINFNVNKFIIGQDLQYIGDNDVKISRKFLVFNNVKEYFKNIENYNTCHEYMLEDSLGNINGRIAFDFDLDNKNKTNYYNDKEFKYQIEVLLGNVLKKYYNVKYGEYVWLTSENKKKSSFHLIIKNVQFVIDWVSCMKQLIKCIKLELNKYDIKSMIDGEIFDEQIYRNRASLRMPLNKKIGGNKLLFDNNKYNFYDGLIHVHKYEDRVKCVNVKYSDCKYKFDNNEYEYEDIDYEVVSIYERFKKEFDVDDCFELQNIKSNGIICLKRVKAGKCLTSSCNRHDSNGAFITPNKMFKFHCHSSKCSNSLELFKNDNWKKKDIKMHLKPMNLLENCELYVDKVVKCNNKYVSNFVEKDLKNLKDKLVFIKSCTGTGKTYAFKTLFNNKNTVSIVPLQSMAYEFAKKESLGLTNYLNVTEYELNQVTNTNSILKCIPEHINEEYVLYLDEYHSNTMRLMSDMGQISKNRMKILEKLDRLIKYAHTVIFTDANLTTEAIKYITSRSKKESVLYINEYVNIKKCEITKFKKENAFLNKLFETGNNNELFICCSDSKKFIDSVHYKYTQQFPNQTVLKYTSETSISQIENLNSKWKNAVIFCSPTILYCLSYDIEYTHHTFGHYTKKSLDSLQCCQQLHRIRQPISMNLYIKNPYMSEHYNSIEQFKKSYNFDYENIQTFNIPLTLNVDEMIKLKRRLNFMAEEFMIMFYALKYKQHLLTKFKDFYIEQFLKAKGFVNFVEYYTTEEENNVEISHDDFISNAVQCYKNNVRNPGLDSQIVDDRINLISGILVPKQNFAKQHATHFIDTKQFNSIFNYLMFKKYNRPDKLKDYKDFKELKINSLQTKFNILANLSKQYNIHYNTKLKDYIYSTNLDTQHTINNYPLIKKVFRMTAKYKQTYSSIEIYQFVMKRYKSLFPWLYHSVRINTKNNKISSIEINDEHELLYHKIIR